MKQLMFTYAETTELPSLVDHGAWFYRFNKKRQYVFDVDDIISIDDVERDGDSIFVYVTLDYVCKE
ncbi:MAG: hypothetical protein ACTSPB_09980 [Candidatus Thorarchaeota archaeon]